MPNYRRAKTPGGTFFFTLVTSKRRPIFSNPECIDLLRRVVAEVKAEYPFHIDAWVLLPDHMHAIWTLPSDNFDYSKRWGLIKARFTKQLRNIEISSTLPRHTMWQKRFWEHQIRNQSDFNAHLDYVHFNPVKHGYVSAVCDWPYSSFHKYVKYGYYPADWGASTDADIVVQAGE